MPGFYVASSFHLLTVIYECNILCLLINIYIITNLTPYKVPNTSHHSLFIFSSVHIFFPFIFTCFIYIFLFVVYVRFLSWTRTFLCNVHSCDMCNYALQAKRHNCMRAVFVRVRLSACVLCARRMLYNEGRVIASVIDRSLDLGAGQIRVSLSAFLLFIVE